MQRLLHVFLALSVSLTASRGLIFEINYPLSDRSAITTILPIPAYGFLPGGSFSASLTVSGLSDGEIVDILLMPEHYWTDIRLERIVGKASMGGRPCGFMPSTFTAQFVQEGSFFDPALLQLMLKDDPQIALNHSLAQAQMLTASSAQIRAASSQGALNIQTPPDAILVNARYVVLAQNCPSASSGVYVKGTLTLLNPNGQHLSLEDIPMLPVSLLYFFAYLTMFVLFTVYSIGFFRPYMLRIHWFLCGAFAFKCLELIVTFSVYLTLSEKGKVSLFEDAVERLFRVCSDCLFSLMLFLISTGWSITRQTLHEREKRLCIVSFGLYAFFRFLYAMCAAGQPRLSPHNSNIATSASQSPSSSVPDDAVPLCSGYVLAYSVISFLITFGIIVSMNANIERLRSMYMESAAWRNVQRQLRHRLHKFRAFRWAFLVYLVLPIILVFIEFAFLTWRQDWLVLALREGLLLFLFAFVGLYFRPDPKLIIMVSTGEVSAETRDVLNARLRDEQQQPIDESASSSNNDHEPIARLNDDASSPLQDPSDAAATIGSLPGVGSNASEGDEQEDEEEVTDDDRNSLLPASQRR
eukprot:ANDGO_05733.mRNA.1 hypothetical protein GUITHDRAFT_100409